MIPVEQTCPKCGGRFVGSDIVGYPCPPCSGENSALTEALKHLTDDVSTENQSEVK